MIDLNDRLDLAFLKEEKERFVCRIGCFYSIDKKADKGQKK